MKCGDPNNPAGPMITVRGKNCNNDCVPGTHRCYIHGGAAPTTLLKAQASLAALRNPAIDVLFNAMIALDEQMEVLRAELELDRDVKRVEALIKAASMGAKTAGLVLDRTGLGPRATLEIKQSDGDLPWQHLLIEEKAELLALMTQVRDLKQRIKTRLLNQPIIDVQKIS